ncbi:hypothetical protein QC763_0069110 [Podospora pseudopauciseta]|uniref:Uncharacterized protein n=2 Tax=Podospora TaxID=5144 RepID=A0ABR0HDN6_9PEZI|nr:hypothetical protein QC763_0069110 [Podospora pseudopauciseta]KAK4677246.1 hypothetical protein QC764_0068790 [Podospora pseudoanserina]
MSPIRATAAIKKEDPKDKPARIYLHSVAVIGAPSIFQRPCKARSFQYTTSETCEQDNTMPFDVLCSIFPTSDHGELQRRLSLGRLYAMVEWRLTNNTASRYPTFKTPHRITRASAVANQNSYKLGFTRSLDWAQAIAARYVKIDEAQRRRLLSVHPLLRAENLMQSRPSSCHRRRRGDSLRITQPRADDIAEKRRCAEQLQQQTGDMSGLLEVMQLQICCVSGVENTSGCQYQRLRMLSSSPPSSMFSERSSSVCSGSC